MKGQPHRRQVRFLVSCAALAALVAGGSLILIRVNCGQLASSSSPAASAQFIGRIEYLTALVLLSVFAGAASLASAGRIILRRYALETDALRRLHKHTVKKAKRIVGKLGGVPSTAKPSSMDSAERDRMLRTAIGASRLLRTGTAEIAGMTEQLRESAIRGFAAETSTFAAKIDARVGQLETAATELDELLTNLRGAGLAESGAQKIRRDQTPGLNAEQLRKLAAAVHSGRRTGASRSEAPSHADLAVI